MNMELLLKYLDPFDLVALAVGVAAVIVSFMPGLRDEPRRYRARDRFNVIVQRNRKA